MSLPNTDFAVPCYYVLAPAEASAEEVRAGLQAQLDELNNMIRQASKAIEPAAVADLETLLQRRERVLAAPTWPVDIAILQRLLFYIIIPPLAWVGAALVEMFVDGFVQR